ncbi:hypothetical protein PHLGIDRAFT_123905 [Phlebiopsis gigantea 11061_1 CR5-6]|uniref:Rdx family-domain-containing protein n=1 Tax=Phlebiopsis gigantea (strain 11061_1 CR5-6) TaxID=745531 RepID=A0A0C3PXJ2_PHLG1|nr:hypothetical protein PHLGIDRAFT_123905 [Phlebiopsis gigantea 11061_1 CR5-6]
MSNTQECVDCQPESTEAPQETVDISSRELAHQVESETVADPLNPATFIPPSPLPTPSITVEFCDRCRWQHRATWVSTELMLTFPTPAIKAITLLPLNSEETGGRFRVWLGLPEQPPRLIWDRKVEGGFPELKILKQRIRDNVQPGKSLGHSDKKIETAA